jgi:hypothetical protein
VARFHAETWPTLLKINTFSQKIIGFSQKIPFIPANCGGGWLDHVGIKAAIATSALRVGSALAIGFTIALEIKPMIRASITDPIEDSIESSIEPSIRALNKLPITG